MGREFRSWFRVFQEYDWTDGVAPLFRGDGTWSGTTDLGRQEQWTEVRMTLLSTTTGVGRGSGQSAWEKVNGSSGTSGVVLHLVLKGLATPHDPSLLSCPVLSFVLPTKLPPPCDCGPRRESAPYTGSGTGVWFRHGDRGEEGPRDIGVGEEEELEDPLLAIEDVSPLFRPLFLPSPSFPFECGYLK